MAEKDRENRRGMDLTIVGTEGRHKYLVDLSTGLVRVRQILYSQCFGGHVLKNYPVMNF